LKFPYSSRKPHGAYSDSHRDVDFAGGFIERGCGDAAEQKIPSADYPVSAPGRAPPSGPRWPKSLTNLPSALNFSSVSLACAPAM